MKTSFMIDNKSTNIENSYNQDAKYWLLMYEELEEQMKQMMKMTLNLIDNEVQIKENELNKKILVIEKKKSELEVKLKQKEKEYKKQISLLKKQNQSLDFERRKLEQFKHRMSVTWIGKINLKYINLKQMIKKYTRGLSD